MNNFHAIDSSFSLHRARVGIALGGALMIIVFVFWSALVAISGLLWWLMVIALLICIAVMINAHSANNLLISITEPTANAPTKSALESSLASESSFNEIFLKYGMTRLCIPAKHIVIMHIIKHSSFAPKRRYYEALAQKVQKLYGVDLGNIEALAPQKLGALGAASVINVLPWACFVFCFFVVVMLKADLPFKGFGVVCLMFLPFFSVLAGASIGYKLGAYLAQKRADSAMFLLSEGRRKIVLHLSAASAARLMEWFKSYLYANHIAREQNRADENLALNPYAARASFGLEALDKQDSGDIFIIP